MSKERDFHIFIKDILNSCDNINEYTDGMDKEEFSKDKKTIDAVIRNLEIIGEASKCLSDEIKTSYPTLN